MRASFADALRSEWTKLRTLRLTAYALALAPLVTTGYSVLLSYLSGNGADPMVRSRLGELDPTAVTLQGIGIAQEVVAVLGVFVISSEYGSGMIRTSLTVVPRRGRLLAAKAAVFGALAVPLGLATTVIPFLAGQAVLASAGARHDSLARPDVLRAVAGGGLYLALVGLIGLALGALVRHTAVGLAVAVLGTLVVPSLLGVLPGPVAHAVTAYWPVVAGSQIMVVHPEPGTLAPWAGLAVLAAWTAALLAAAFATLRARDV